MRLIQTTSALHELRRRPHRLQVDFQRRCSIAADLTSGKSSHTSQVGRDAAVYLMEMDFCWNAAGRTPEQLLENTVGLFSAEFHA